AGSTCIEWMIVPNTADVTASCTTNAGGGHDTRISLGNCLANDDGVLSCRVGGGAGNSCVFTSIFQRTIPVLITATCKTANGGTRVNSNFVLSDCLTNQNGVLTC
ncbi:hypothetical protein C8F01DRAFT_991894, partial [Mycena amicta]